MAAVLVPAGRVLVVDDDEQVRDATSRLLRRLSLQAVCVADGEAALALLAVEEDIAFVILDLTMPGLPGEEVLRRLRASGSLVPVVIASGNSQSEIDARVQLDARTFTLAKPYTLAELRALLTRAGFDLPPRPGQG